MKKISFLFFLSFFSYQEVSAQTERSVDKPKCSVKNRLEIHQSESLKMLKDIVDEAKLDRSQVKKLKLLQERLLELENENCRNKTPSWEEYYRARTHIMEDHLKHRQEQQKKKEETY